MEENTNTIFNAPEIEDMPDFEGETTETAFESAESVDNDTADAENEIVSEEKEEKTEGKETKETKEDKLSPYEKVILAEMERRAKEDTLLADALKNKGKSIKECFRYVTMQAKKRARGNCAMIEDAVVYGWAHHYYIESKETIEKEMPKYTTPKPTTTTTPTATTKKGAEKPKPVKNVVDITKAIVSATKPKEDGKKGKREKKKDNLLAGFVPMERPNMETYEKDGKKGSREQAKSVEQMDLFADFFAE